MDNKKPTMTSQNGRRKSGGSTHLRSPVVKRPSSAPVSIQGWLHKQGSEGLMLWKKRWFVLSEYCLFYYKGPEEEKLLGSILLPSYKVSPCTADDKVYRKFSFKAEHANMRTYYFAAETRELMTRWMNALSLATILQEGGKIQNQIQPSMTSVSSTTSQNSENSSCDFKGYRPCSGPITIQPTSQREVVEKNNLNLNGWMPQPPGNSYQPLYANAPPKPKRLNNDGQYGSSPEASPTRQDDSENVIYGNRKQFQQGVSPNREQEYSYYHYKSSFSSGPDLVRSMPQAMGRKTPDFLGAAENQFSNYLGSTPIKVSECYNFSDLNKNDNSNRMIQIPEKQSFLGYGNPPNQITANYQHSNQYYQSYQKVPQMSSSGFPDAYKIKNDMHRKNPQPPRPHSADFLDHDTKKYYFNKENKEMNMTENIRSRTDQNTRPPRPKSSLDILHTNDGYYWTEERYAEKMRQSAIYLQNTLPQRSQSSRTNTPNLKQVTQTRNFVNYKCGKSEENSVEQNVLWDVTKFSSLTQNPSRWSEQQDLLDNYFIRSASARLPKSRALDEENDEVQAYTGGKDFDEGRKEDSMKRLLEWKQRMLQSPLTRKPSGSSTRGIAQNDLSKSYKQQLTILKELEKRGVESREESEKKRVKPDGKRIQNRNADCRRSAILSSDRYYNYSSDDEENEGTSDKRSQRSTQAGNSRKGIQEPKEKRVTPNSEKAYISPDYENVTDSLILRERTKQVYAPRKTEEFSSRDGSTNPSTKETTLKTEIGTKQPEADFRNETSPDGGTGGCYEILRQSRDASDPPLLDTPVDRINNSDQRAHSQNPVSKKRNWNEKIDETKLIKEFSYQYIKDTKIPEKTFTNNYKVLDAPPENIVKSRIKQLELVGQTEADGSEAIMKEPLKVSSPVYSLNEAHVSNLKNADIKAHERGTPAVKASSDNFQNTLGNNSKDTPQKHQKSVKDLLADFERKSQFFQEKEALEHERSFEEMPGKRYVFSDTETLLYDSSSDTEEKKEEPDPGILNSLKKSKMKSGVTEELTEEEDGDEEVAAALGRREGFFSSCRDIRRRRDSESSRNKQLTKHAGMEPSPSSEVETLMTPGYVCSSLTELVSALESSDSTCSTPTIDKIKDNLEKALPKENLSKPAKENLTETKEEDCEGHYMPMTPSRRVSAPSSDKSRSNSSLHSFFLAIEETYVEMAENGFSASYPEPNNSSLSTIRKAQSGQDSPGYREIPNEQGSHYDFLYRTTSLREPEYMEVNTLLEILKEQDEKIKEQKDAAEDSSQKQSNKISHKSLPPTPPRSVLPDILNSSSNGQQITKSDSSDADDESSKDLDSLDVPRHPRFSLSDTFRPASYYLGSIINERKRNLIRLPNSCENHDSSDSDLVSPPPIPTSPALLDDLDNSLETEKPLEIRPSMSKVKPDRGGQDRTGCGKKMWSMGNQDSENDANTQKKKRRPVSEDVVENFEKPEESLYGKPLVFSELDTVGSRNGLAIDEDNEDINLDKYLEELQLSGNVHLFSKNFSEEEIHKNLMPKENINKADSNEKTLLKLKYQEESCGNTTESETIEQPKKGDEVQYENLQAFFPPPPPELYDSGNDHSDRESNLAFYSNVVFPEVPPPDNYCDVYEPEVTGNSNVCFNPVTLQQQTGPENAFSKTSAFENQGAPYYYSDIIKNDEENFGGLPSDKSLSGMRSFLSGYKYQTLNNQRGDLQETNQGGKRNDIGRKVNPINENSAVGAGTPVSDLDEVQKITAELRTTSAHFMGAADKLGSVDLRNIYESDTLQRRKVRVSEDIRARTPDLHHLQGVTRNLYPHGLKDKTVGPHLPSGCCDAFQSRARSRSLEGLLSDIGCPAEGAIRYRTFHQTSNNLRGEGDAIPSKPQANHFRISSCEGDEPWEKDALWRENLRRASLRHTRSLDNLDDEVTNTIRRLNLSNESAAPDETESKESRADYSPSACQSGRSVDMLGSSRPKLSRDVTYVNDSFRKNRQLDSASEYEHDYREGRVRPRKKEKEIQNVIELSESNVLDCDDGVHYEKLARNRVKLETPAQSGNYTGTFDKKEGSRNQHEDAGSSSNQKAIAKDPLNVPLPQVNPSQGLALKPIDREKLRQWDLMSSGMVEQEMVQKKVTNVNQQDTCEKQLNLDEKTSAHLSVFVRPQVQSGDTRSQLQGSTHSLEASGSGSAVRDSDLSTLTSCSSQILQKQKPSIQSPLSPSMPRKEETFLDQKDGISTDRTLNDFKERLDYYDRGKSYLVAANDYTEWDEPYSGSRREINGDDIINYSDKGRSNPESHYHVGQYQERKSYTEGSRNCVTLPVVKSEGFGPLPLTNIQSVGRSTGSSDGRYAGRDTAAKRMSSSPWELDVSAGELLGRTHEELVLLLIQLRRQSASICKAMEACHIEIEEQARMAALDTPTRLEHIKKLEKLKKHLLELEKQYEKGKPLVNLVDNMVKLGSLYKGSNYGYNTSLGLDFNPDVREKLEFNQKVQEQRLLAEERRDWDRLSPDHGQLQAKVQQLYKLDRLLQEESGTLHTLQQDKELLEKALGGLRHKLQVNRSNPVETDRYRKQQKLLEKELSRVRLLLAHNSKKLEETVAENARLEQELVILRQKLQASRVSSRNSMPLLPESTTWSTTAALEAELRRVQQLVGDLQRQRHELSAQVKQLTEKSDTLVQQIRPGPTGVAGAGPILGKKKSCSTWLETDLDLLVTQDVSVENLISHQNQQQPPPVTPGSRSTTPIYINADTNKKDVMSTSEVQSPVKLSSAEDASHSSYCTPVELSEADERMKRFYGIIPKEKQEIKTVRIVKRESERRQRDRDRNGNIGIPVGNTAVAKRASVIEENDGYGLERVDEESYESSLYSPNFSESGSGGNYQFRDYAGQEGKSDPYVNYHPTNPFLPQNLNQVMDEASRVKQDVTSSTGQKSLSLPRGFRKSNIPVYSVKNDSSSEQKCPAPKRSSKVQFEIQCQSEGEGEKNLNGLMNEKSKNYDGSVETEYSLRRAHLKNFNVGQELNSSSGGMNPSQITKQKNQDFAFKERRADMMKPLTPKEQLFEPNYSSQGGSSPQLSPVYQSEAARQIIMEMSNNSVRNDSNRRQIRKEKRRHHTVSHIRHVPESEDHLKMGFTRSRDDLDMERALRPRINAPDVVRSTMSQQDLKYNESTIDNILGTPNKIVIPERYIPEQEELTAEEQLQRLRKAESIRKMLSETTALSTPDLSGGEGLEEERKSFTLRKKVEEEKKQREHILELNQILAQQVMEKSKLVAVKALAAHPLEKERSFDEEDLSPLQPLPIHQQRENFFS